VEKTKEKILKLVQNYPDPVGMPIYQIYKHFAPNPDYSEILDCIDSLMTDKKIELLEDRSINKLRII